MKNTILTLLISFLLITSCKENKVIDPDITVTLSYSQSDLLNQLAAIKTKRNIYIDTYNTTITKFNTDTSINLFELFGNVFFQLHPTHSLSSIFNIEENNNKLIEIESLCDLKTNLINNQIRLLDTRFSSLEDNVENIEYRKRENNLTILIKGNVTEQKIRKIISTKAKLDFFDTYKNTGIGNQIFEDVNKVLSNKMYPGYTDSVKNKASDTQKYFDSTTEITGDIDWDEYYGENISEEMQNEVFRKVSPLSAYLFPYSNSENQWIEGSVLGYSKLSDTSKVNDFLSRYYVNSVLPVRDLTFMWEAESIASTSENEPLLMLYLIKGKSQLSNKDITNASQSFDPTSNTPIVSLQFNSEGTVKWSQITAISAQNNTGIAITLNNKVYSAPVASARIEGGSTQITGGSFSGENGMLEARDLANIINAGSMPIYYEIKSIIKHQKEDK